ncbi:MAG: TrkH family potassium uptake protein [Candidatus Hydrothermarchaeaceae archaeon]
MSNLGLILTITSPTFFIPIVAAILYKEYVYIAGFILGFILMLATGMGLWKLFESEREMKLRHAIAVTALAYLVIALFSAVPLGPVAPTFLDAYFEAMSGWTATGLTTIGGGADTFPHSINLWRHLMQYVGGMGIVVMSLVVLSKAGTGIESMAFYSSETRTDKIGASMISTVRMLWILYLGFLLVSTIALHLAGMNWFDAITHAMSGISTAGFSTHAESVGYFNSVLIEVVLMVVMIVGSLNFLVLYAALRGNLGELVKNIEHKVGVLLFIIFIIPMVWGLATVYSSTPHAVRVGVFHLVSAFTNTGWMIESPANISMVWSQFATVLLVLTFFLGGSAGSTAGSLKRIRIALISMAIWSEIKRVLAPEGTIVVSKFHHMEERIADDKNFREVFVLVFAHLVLVSLTTLLAMAYGYPLIESFFEASSALMLVGQTSGITEVGMPALLKVAYILNMWAGRLEVIPALIFLVELKGFFIERK